MFNIIGSGMNLLDIHIKDWNQTALDACAPGLRKLLGVPVASCSILGSISDYYVQCYASPAIVKCVPSAETTLHLSSRHEAG